MNAGHVCLSLVVGLLVSCGKDAPAPEPAPAPAPAPAPTPPPSFLVWTRAIPADSARPYRTAWITADGEGFTVRAGRAEAAVFDGTGLWAIQPRWSPFREVPCEGIDAPEHGEPRHYSWLAARSLGSDRPGQALYPAYAGSSEDEPAKAGGLPTYVGEHWGRSIQLVGSAGGRLFTTSCDGGFSCGAHGSVDCRFQAHDLARGGGEVALDLGAAASELAHRMRDLAADWRVEGANTPVPPESLELVAFALTYSPNDVGCAYTFARESTYADSGAGWSSYTQSASIGGPVAKALQLPEVPATVRAYLASLGTNGVFGWSTVPSSDTLLASFRDMATLGPPDPKTSR